MASVTVGENQLQRIIRDLHDAAAELTKLHLESGEPITDDSASLHKFSYKLEYLLQFDQKEKRTFLGNRKDYWDYFCDCLSKIKGANDGIRFVKSISELKTSLGKGRAFIRYCLVHQRLADTLQQCLINQMVTCDWYYARSPFLKPHFNSDIINHLYELNEIQFDVASRGYDLDSEWPTFARRTVGSVVPATHVWRPPSRCSSVNSLVSNYSQQTHEFLPGPDLGTSMIGDLGEPSCSEADDLRCELDQSELRQRSLQEEVKLLKQEVADLQEKLLAAVSGNTNGEWTEGQQALKTTAELLAKPGGTLSEKSRQVQHSESESAMTTEELLCKLKEVEQEKLKAQCKSQEWARQAEKLNQELKAKEEKLRGMEETLAKQQKEVIASAMEQADELQATVIRLQGILSLKEREVENLHTQLQDLQSSLEARNQQLKETKRKAQGGYNELKEWSNSQKETLNSQIVLLQEQLKAKDIELSLSTQKIQQLNDEKVESPSRKLDEYKAQCASLMEINAKLVQTMKHAEEKNREMVQTKTSLENELVTLKAISEQLNERLNLTGLTVEEREKKLLEENQHLKESIQKAQLKIEYREEKIKRLEKANEDPQAPMMERVEESDDGPSCSNNKSQQSKYIKDVSELALAEAQLDLNMKEVSRLQEEVLELQAQLQFSSEERMKIQAIQEVTETSREDFCTQTNQLKSQVEELNRRHIEELLQCHEREEALLVEVESEAQARATLQAQMDTTTEALHVLKSQTSTLALENEEAKEALHKANTEVAELGVHVCMLTGQNDEAKMHNEELLSKMQELEEMQNEVQKLKLSVEALTKDNTRLLEELKQAEEHPKATQKLKQRLEKAEEEARSMQESNQREIDALRLQLGEAATNHQNQIKVLNEELLSTRSQMLPEQEKVFTLETRLAELEALNTLNIQNIEEKNACIAKSDSLLQQKEEQLSQVQEDLSKVREEVTLTKKACQDLSENLRKAVMEKETCDLKASAEIDDLYRTKRNLEERLIELIREKDVLWQKSDALEFEQKLRAEEQLDRELPYCFGCHSQFSWWLRRHICKLCGRPFCYNCCANIIISQQGGTRERCCKDCYTRHGAGEHHHSEDPRSLSPPSRSPLASTPTRPSMPSVSVALQSPRSDDAAFDIITDEEVNCVYEADSLPYTTALSPGSMQQGPHDLSSSTSGGDITADEFEDLLVSVQDTELCLLKSGEITQSVPHSVEEILEFGKESRELFIKSSCYSLIPITVVTTGSTISWEFSSTPKSVSFSVVYRERAATPAEEAKVMIPLTRCSSHKEPIKGQIKIRNPGVYSLIFDNSFSRFISKKVQYRLSVENQVAYDGKDCSP